MWSKQPVNKEEAVELLGSVLKKHGYAMTRKGRVLTVLALDAVKTADTAIVVGNDPRELEKSDESQTQIIPVRYASATQLVPNLQQLLPSTATLSANENANTLILVATKTDINRMLRIINALDNSMAKAELINVRLMRHADARQIAPLITQLFAQQDAGRLDQGNRDAMNVGGGPGPGVFGGLPGAIPEANGRPGAGEQSRYAARVVAVADERANAVVVSAPPASMVIIKNVLDKLDQQVGGTKELRLFRLTNADPFELSLQVERVFGTTSSNTAEEDTAPLPMFSAPGDQSGADVDTDPASVNSNQRGKKIGNVLAVAEPRTSSVIVTAPKALMPQIAELVSTLDANAGKREIVGYFELRNADPQDVSQNLQDLFMRSNAGMENNNQNGLLGMNNPLSQRRLQNQNQQSTTGTAPGAGGSTGTSARSGQ